MCRIFYKYFLITSTSFMATGGLYFAILSRWLWTSPIYDYGDYDWRKIPESIGAISFILFSIGLLIVLRSNRKELFIFALILSISIIIIIILILMIHIIEKRSIINFNDFFLFIILILLLTIILHIFLYIGSLKNYQTNCNNNDNNNNNNNNNNNSCNKKSTIIQQQQQQQPQQMKTSIYLPQHNNNQQQDTFEL